MKNKFCSLILIFLFPFSVYSQDNSDYTNVLTNFLDWLPKVDSFFTKIIDKERLKRIDRQLDFTATDIKEITLLKVQIAEKLKSKEFDNDQTLQPLLKETLSKLASLKSRLQLIESEVINANQYSLEKVINSIELMANQKMRLIDLIGKLFGDETEIEKIKKHADESVKLAKLISDNIFSARVQFHKKF